MVCCRLNGLRCAVITPSWHKLTIGFFVIFMKAGIKNFAVTAIRWQKLPMKALIFAG